MYFEVTEERKQEYLNEYVRDPEILDKTLYACQEIDICNDEEEQNDVIEEILMNYCAGEHARKFYSKKEAFRSLGEIIADVFTDKYEVSMNHHQKAAIARVRECSNIK